MGDNFDLELYNKAPLADLNGLGFGEDVPSTYSLKMYTPYPGDQGDYGTCVGWASTYGALTTQYARQAGWTDRNKITAMAFDPLFAYAQLKGKGDWNCQWGSNGYKAMSLFKTMGAKRFLVNQYDCGKAVDEQLVQQGRLYRIKSFKRLFTFPEGYDQEDFFTVDVDKAGPVRQAIGNGHAVLFGAYLPYSFSGYRVLWGPSESEKATVGPVYRNDGGLRFVTNDKDTLGGHAMFVVGYDDSRFDGAGGFEIQNSWGEGCHDQGYFWISYADFDWFCKYAFYFELFSELAPTAGCVTGDCDDGYGRYVFDNGDMYEGQWSDGEYSGYGVYVWANGSAHGGVWKNNKRDGLATVVSSDKQFVAWEWSDDQPSNFFMIVEDEVEEGCVEGDCENGYGTRKYGNGMYSGHFKDGRRSGFGTYTFNEGGNKFSGSWINGQMEGAGKLTWPGGAYWVGEWVSTSRTGYGIEYWADGYYGGYWLEGASQEDWGSVGLLPVKTFSPTLASEIIFFGSTGDCVSGDCEDGYGELSYGNGDRYEGYFKDGSADGSGSYHGFGWKYNGTWVNGLFDGFGKVIWDDGTYFIGEFRKGKQDGYGVEVSDAFYVPGVWEFGDYKLGQTTLGFGEVAQRLSLFNDMADLDQVDKDLLRAFAARSLRTR